MRLLPTTKRLFLQTAYRLRLQDTHHLRLQVTSSRFSNLNGRTDQSKVVNRQKNAISKVRNSRTAAFPLLRGRIHWHSCFLSVLNRLLNNRLCKSNCYYTICSTLFFRAEKETKLPTRIISKVYSFGILLPF